MNNRFRHIILMLTAIPLMTACSNDEGNIEAKQAIRLKGQIATNVQGETRAATNLYEVFDGGEQIDVSIYGGSSVVPANVIVAENLLYTIANDGAMTPPTGQEPYFPVTADGQVTIRASYPTSGNTATTSVTVLADQTTDDNYKAGEMFWATETATRTTGTTAVALTFQHRMSKIIVNLTSRYGQPILPSTVKLLDFLPTATLTKATGAVAASGTAIDITMSVGGAAMVPPQTIAADTPIFEIVTAQNEIAQYKSPTALEFKPGYVYTYDVQVDMRKIIVTTSITSWGTPDAGNIFQGDIVGEEWS